MEGYSVKIASAPDTLTAKQRVMLKDTSNAISIDEATRGSNLIIDYDYHAVLDVHNEKSADKDYKKYVIVDKAGNKFVTGSESFISALNEIVEEMDGTDEAYQIEVYRKPSKNYSGKEFITCSVI